MYFKITFNPKFLKLNSGLQTLRECISAVKENYELDMIVAMILKIGNFLNQGTNKGNSSSFQIGLLNSLSFNKGVGKHSKKTMMDFLLLNILAKQPKVVSFAEKLRPCEAGAKIDLGVLKQQLQDCLTGVDLIKTEVTAREEMLKQAKQRLEANVLKEECGESTEKDRAERKEIETQIENVEDFLTQFKGFQNELTAKTEYAKTELEELTQSVGELIKSYGLEPKDVPPKEFFEIFFLFQKEFTQTYRNLLAKQKAAEEKRKREAKKRQDSQELQETMRMTVETSGMNYEQLKEKLREIQNLGLLQDKKKAPAPKPQQADTSDKPTKKAKKIEFVEKPETPPKERAAMNQSVITADDCSVVILDRTADLDKSAFNASMVSINDTPMGDTEENVKVAKPKQDENLRKQIESINIADELLAEEQEPSVFAPNESQRIVNKGHREPTKEELFQMLGQGHRRETKSF